MPAFVQAMLPWIPSVPLAEIFQLAFLESAPLAQAWEQLGIVALVSAPFYLLTAWKLRRLE